MGSQLTVRGKIGWLDISSMVKEGAPQMDQEKIGKFIASCRKETGLTQAALADKLNITDRAVSKWETGRSLPDVSIMLELCNLLNISVNVACVSACFFSENWKRFCNIECILFFVIVTRRNCVISII